MNWEVSQKQGQNPEIFLSGISEWSVKEKDITLKRMGSVVVSRSERKGMGAVVRPSGKISSRHLGSHSKVTEEQGDSTVGKLLTLQV